MSKSVNSLISVYSATLMFILAMSIQGFAETRPVTQRAKLEQLNLLYSKQLDARRPQLYYDVAVAWYSG